MAATVLNSTPAEADRRERWRGLNAGEFKLLYLAPERLMAGTMLEDLRRWRVATVAVDEAHCISEWGHDFRPEYRQLRELRSRLDPVPFMALTATATDRVRKATIVSELHLRDPAVYVQPVSTGPTCPTASSPKPRLTGRCSSFYGRGRRIVGSFIAPAGRARIRCRRSWSRMASRPRPTTRAWRRPIGSGTQ